MTEDLESKLCARCGHKKARAEFSPHPRMASGLQSYCRACVSEKKRAKYWSDPEARRQERANHYHKNKNRPDRKAKKREYDREYRKRNAKRLDDLKETWIAENKTLVAEIKRSYKSRRRAKERAGSTTAEVAAWLARQKMVCYWCGLGCKDSFHVDHYVPLARGGLHDVSNLVIACPQCNLSKNARDPYEFAADRGRLF